MEGDELLRSSKLLSPFVFVVAVMVISGCSRGAPTLPSVNQRPQPEPIVQKTPTELSEQCEKYNSRLSRLRQEEDTLNWQIKGDRGKNQVAGYLGAFLILPYLATEHHPQEKARLDAIQIERDGIYQEMKARRCPTPEQ